MNHINVQFFGDLKEKLFLVLKLYPLHTLCSNQYCFLWGEEAPRLFLVSG